MVFGAYSSIFLLFAVLSPLPSTITASPLSKTRIPDIRSLFDDEKAIEVGSGHNEDDLLSVLERHKRQIGGSCANCKSDERCVDGKCSSSSLQKELNGLECADEADDEDCRTERRIKREVEQIRKLIDEAIEVGKDYHWDFETARRKKKREAAADDKDKNARKKCFGPECEEKDDDISTTTTSSSSSSTSNNAAKPERTKLEPNHHKSPPPFSDMEQIRNLEKDARSLLKTIEERYKAEINKLQVIDKKLHELSHEGRRRKDEKDSTPKPLIELNLLAPERVTKEEKLKELEREIESKTTAASIGLSTLNDGSSTDSHSSKTAAATSTPSSSTSDSSPSSIIPSSNEDKKLVDKTATGERKKLDAETAVKLGFPRDAQGMSNKALPKGLESLLPKLSKAMLQGQPSNVNKN